MANCKYAEKLLILKDAGEGVMSRLVWVKKMLTSPTQRPAFFSDQQYGKVTAALIKKFPEFEQNVDKTPGFELLTGKGKQFFEEVEPYYNAFVDAFEFKEAAVAALFEVGSGTVEMKLDENPTLTAAFMDLFVTYAQMNIFVSQVEEKKILLTVFYKIFFFVKCVNEPNYLRVANYLNAFADPIRAMQEEFKTLTTSLGRTLTNVMQLYTKIRTIPVMRKDGALNITLKPEEMAKPITDKFHYQAIYSGDISNWILFGFLLCPETLSLPGAVDLCKFAMSESFVVPVARNLTYSIMTEYDDLFSNYKSKTFNLTKQKKIGKDAIQDAVSKSHLKHKERRTYIRQELNNLHRLFIDEPALMGPKFPLLLCGLSLAKEEVFWYFRHIKAQPPKGFSRKVTDDELRDNRISELIHLMVEFVDLISTHKAEIQSYYLQYLRGPDTRRLSELFSATNFHGMVSAGIGKICNSILDEIKAVDQNDFNHDFKGLRLNWFRVESSLSSLQSNTPIVKVKDVVDRLNLIANHTRYVDDIDRLLDQYASLRELWYYRDSFYETFSRAIKDGPNQPLHAMSFLKVISSFPSNASFWNGEEQAEIGQQAWKDAEKLYQEVCERIIALINEVAKNYLGFEAGLAEINAAYPLLQKRKDYKPPKDFVPPAIPGSESEFRKRAQLDRLRLYERNTWQLCYALNEFSVLNIYDMQSSPREYLRGAIGAAFKQFLRAYCMTEYTDEKHQPQKVIQRPSVFESQVNVYISSLKLMENFIDLDISEIVREVLLSEVWMPALGRNCVSSFEWLNMEETDIKYDGSFLGQYVAWYADFITKKLVPSGAIYSPVRHGFVSKPGSLLKYELYADVFELKAFYRLVGPYGFKMLERELIKFVLLSVSGIKDSCSHNRQMLDELSKNYYAEGPCNEALKKLRDPDGFLQKALGIGNALSFRDLMFEAVEAVSQESVPFIHNVANNAFNQYKRNTFMLSELLPIDQLAHDSGIDTGTADQVLKKFLNKAIGSADAPLMDLLPYLFAASFISNYWREAQYKAAFEAYQHNAHTLAKTISGLITCIKAITLGNPDEREIVNQLKLFLEVSSVILLRMARTTYKQEKLAPVDFPSIIVFMDIFVNESPLLNRELLESCMPYALLRNEWKSLFTVKGGKGAKNENVTGEF